MRSIPVLAITAAALAVTWPAATATAATAAVGCESGTGAKTAASSSYRFTLRVGNEEKMYTHAQVKSMHPKHGEVMLSGTMAMGGMSMGGSMRHLEVQICTKASVVLTHAKPKIRLTDTTMKGKPVTVPIAVMEGIGEGVSDLHYGNNVSMPARHRFAVAVTVGGERVVFHVTSPKVT